MLRSICLWGQISGLNVMSHLTRQKTNLDASKKTVTVFALLEFGQLQIYKVYI